MKLLHCRSCGDIIALRYGKMRYCECGKSGGRYTGARAGVPDEETGIIGHVEVFGEEAYVLGLATEDVKRIPQMFSNPYRVDILRCWLITDRAYDAREVTHRDVAK